MAYSTLVEALSQSNEGPMFFSAATSEALRDATAKMRQRDARRVE